MLGGRAKPFPLAAAAAAVAWLRAAKAGPKKETRGRESFFKVAGSGKKKKRLLKKEKQAPPPLLSFFFFCLSLTSPDGGRLERSRGRRVGVGVLSSRELRRAARQGRSLEKKERGKKRG